MLCVCMDVCVCVCMCVFMGACVSTRTVVRKGRGNAFQREASLILRNNVSTGAEPQDVGREGAGVEGLRTANLGEAKMWSEHFIVFLSRGLTWPEMWGFFCFLFLNHSNREADTTAKAAWRLVQKSWQSTNESSQLGGRRVFANPPPHF